MFAMFANINTSPFSSLLFSLSLFPSKMTTMTIEFS